MRIHILGICGTFMAGIACLAKEAGYEVTGSDEKVYPPMSQQLEALGIQLSSGYLPENLPPKVDKVIVGNVIRRGNPLIEHIMNKGIPYLSGPEWLYNHILKDRHVLAVAGTHGKTTTTSLLTWILESAGLNPGFLIGGVPENFGVSAKTGKGSLFVIEADEYDSAFFDKRSKFIHYHPRTLIMNNLEFDHADIFPNLEAIKQQFHYLVRTVPGNGLIVYHEGDANLVDVMSKGVWSQTTTFASHGHWQARLIRADGSHFEVLHNHHALGEVSWNLLGQHNVENALAALAAAEHVGVSGKIAIKALASFKNVKRRLEVKGQVNGITLYDDFAHHPTAIATTLQGLRAKIGDARLIAVVELGSYTMRTGIHKMTIKDAFNHADYVFVKQPDSEDWGLSQILEGFKQPTSLYADVDSLVSHLSGQLTSGDHVVVMSNSSFGGIHQKLLTAMQGVA